MSTDLREYAKRDSFRSNDDISDLLKESKAQTAALQDLKSTQAADDNIPQQPTDSNEADRIKEIDIKLSKSLEYGKTISDMSILGTSQLDSLVSITDRMNENVKELSSRLRDKMMDDAVAPVQNVPTTTKVVEDLVDKNEPTIERPNVPEIIEPKQEKKSDGLLVDSQNKKEDDTKETQDKNFFRGAFESVKKAITVGFKQSVSITDKIFSMLFKFSVVALARAAAIAAAILAIIVGLDLLKIYWAYWGQQIVDTLNSWIEKIVSWVETFGEWIKSFGDWLNIFQNMDASLTGIKTAWESGDFPALAIALGKSLMDLSNSIVSAIGRVGTDLLAGLMRVMGFKDAADKVEAAGLQHYQNRTNNELDPDNQRKIAKYQVDQEKKDGKTSTERGVFSFLPTNVRKFFGNLNDDEVSQINAEKADKSYRANMSEEEKISNTMASNEARHSLERYKDMAKAVNPANKSDLEKLEKYKKVAQDNINKPILSKTPTVKSELQATLDSIAPGGKRTEKPKVSPRPVADNPDVQRVNSIQSAQRTKDRSTTDKQQPSTNIQTNVQKTNKTIMMQRPVTNTRAPGFFESAGVN